MLTSGDVAQLCTAGGSAPSGGNAQPWRVTVAGNRMVIDLDPRRSNRDLLDVGGYASRFAIGCFAENLGIAARSLGLRYDRAIRDGTVEFVFSGRGDPTDHELSGVLRRRVTNRQLASDATLAEPDVRRLVEVVPAGAADCAVTALATDGRKRDVAEALGTADAVRLRNRRMFGEMVGEICWSEREARARGVGLDLRTLQLPAGVRGLLAVLRRLPWLRGLVPPARLTETARSLVLGCSHICCLSTSAPLTPDTMVGAGMAMQRLWLSATRDGVWVHPWTAATFELVRLEVFAGAELTGPERAAVAGIGQGLRDAFGLGAGDHPLMVFRLLAASPPAVRSLRLPWQSFTQVEERR